MTNAIFIKVRIGSTRFLKKSLLNLQDPPVIEQVIWRM